MDGWIQPDNTLTSKAVELLSEVDAYFKKTKAKVKKAVLGEDSREFIKQYRESFPNMLLPSGKYARVNAKQLEDAFQWFFQTYPEYADWELILRAVRKYVHEGSERDWKGMRTSKYFIKKSDIQTREVTSDLADYCEYLLEADEEPELVTFSTKVV